MLIGKLISSALVAFALLAAGCAPAALEPPQPAAQQPRQGGILRVSTLGAPPRALHPYPEPQHNTTPRSNAATLMYARLIDVDWDKLDFVADPRRSMASELPRVSADGRTYTFTLRDDIKWSDGKPITSDDFLFAFENASKQENNYVGFNDLDRIESFRTPNVRTIEVIFKAALARPLALSIFSDHVHPVPTHVWEGRPWYDPDGNPEMLKPTVVSGPYLPTESTAERHAYTRNPNWWGKPPNIDEIVFVNASPTTIVELLRTRQVEWAEAVPPAQFADLKNLPDINPIEMSGAVGSYRIVQFNLARPLLADKRVREALVRAIHRDDLIQFEDDLAVPQFGPYPQNNTRWVNPTVEKYAFDLNRSRRLLEEAGMRLVGGILRDGADQPVRFEILWPTTSQPRGKMAAYLQQQWRQLGIEATVTGMEFSAFVDRYQRQRDFDVAMGALSTTTFDPDEPKTQLMTNGTRNAVGYSNPRVDELFERGAAEQDERRRKEIYDQLQRIIVEDLPIYYMLTTKNPTAFDKRVGGVSPLKGGHILRQNNLQVLDWYLTQ